MLDIVPYIVDQICKMQKIGDDSMTTISQSRIIGNCCVCGQFSLQVIIDIDKDTGLNHTRIQCKYIDCPDPLAWSKLIKEAYYPEHIVNLETDTFSVQHPIRERLQASRPLFECGLHTWIAARDRPPAPLGMYSVSWDPENPDETNFTLIGWNRYEGHHQ